MLQTMNTCRSTAIGVCLALMSADVATLGVTLDFTQISREPNTIQTFYDQVTITAGGQNATWPFDSGLATVTQGVGLGSATFGPSTSLDRKERSAILYNAGHFEWRGIGGYRESLTIHTLGRLNSITFDPYFLINGMETTFLPFEFTVIQTINPKYMANVASGTEAPFTWNNPGLDYLGPSSFEVCLEASMGNTGVFYEHAMEHPNEWFTFEYGFTIKSIDYTHVPEQSQTLILVALSCVGIMAARTGRAFLA